jgi:hypothetical protein
MTILQATGGLAYDEMVGAARTSPSEIDRLFDCNLDTYTPGNHSQLSSPLTVCCCVLLCRWVDIIIPESI